MRKGKDYYIDKDGSKCDPKEFDPKYKEIFDAADKEAEENLKKQDFKPPRMGYCHWFWPEKQRILKEKYNIDWKTPSELNPEVLFD